MVDSKKVAELWGNLEKADAEPSDFFSWGQNTEVMLRLEKSITQYDSIEFPSTFLDKHGNQVIDKFLEILIYDESESEFVVMKLKVNSKRLRKALLDFAKTKPIYPINVKLLKIGSGYSTTYRVEEIKDNSEVISKKSTKKVESKKTE